MALEAEERVAPDGADQLRLVGPETHTTSPEAVEVVELARHVDRGPSIPQRSVRRERRVVTGHRSGRLSCPGDVAQWSDHANRTSGARSAAWQKATSRPVRS